MLNAVTTDITQLLLSRQIFVACRLNSNIGSAGPDGQWRENGATALRLANSTCLQNEMSISR
jgi:hypothetical protein